MQIYSVQINDQAQGGSVIHIQDKRGLKSLSAALVSDGHIVVERVEYAFASYQSEAGETFSTASVTVKERIALFAPYVSRLTLIELPGNAS